MSAWDGEERFSLLLLEEDEYYFRDHSCQLWKDADTRCAVIIQQVIWSACTLPDTPGMLQAARPPAGVQRWPLLRAQGRAGAHHQGALPGN